MLGRSKIRTAHIQPKILLTIIVIGLLGFFAFIQWKDEAASFWPGHEAITKALEQLKTEQERYRKALNVARELDVDLKSLRQYGKGFWLPEDGDVETQTQKMIEDAASSVGLSLTRVGRVRAAKICDGVNTVEINISAEAPMTRISGFIDKVYHLKPRLHWHRLTLRPDSLRDPKNVVLNGNLRFIAITDEGVAALLTESGGTNET